MPGHRLIIGTCDGCATAKRSRSRNTIGPWRRFPGRKLRVSALLEFEFRQSMRLQVWLRRQDRMRGYSQTEADQMLAAWESDIAAGHVEIVPSDTDVVLRLAEHLSKAHTPLAGNRSLNILHVATAKHLSATNFLSFDVRQQQLAKAAGLKTPL